jgi:D-alanine-D-alanine ligase-like ATP-grasp enzyme
MSAVNTAKKLGTHACVYCGDSPVNHPLQYFEAALGSISSVFSKPREKSVHSFFQLERSEVAAALVDFFVFLAAKCTVITFQINKETTKSSRTKSIWNEADRRGIPMQEIRVFGLQRDTERAWLRTKKGSRRNRWFYFQSIPIPPWLDQYGVSWADDKQALKKVFTRHNLPIPKGKAVLTTSGALKVFQSLGTAAITKPRQGSRGRHTTVEIKSEKELVAAFIRARQLCPYVLVEEFIPGKIYRATVIGKKVIGVMELVRPYVVADGIMTIDQLRIHHNLHNKDFPQLTDVEDSKLFQLAIVHQGYSNDSIPEKGTQILLAEFSERSNGGYFIDCTDEVPSDTIITIERAAHVCGVDLVGFDIISRDLTNEKERFVFIEANTLPYIEIHDIPYSGKPRNVSGAVFDLWK